MKHIFSIYAEEIYDWINIKRHNNTLCIPASGFAYTLKSPSCLTGDKIIHLVTDVSEPVLCQHYNNIYLPSSPHHTTANSISKTCTTTY